MISERGDPITIINGVTIKKVYLQNVSRPTNNYVQECPYTDYFTIMLIVYYCIRVFITMRKK